MHKEVGVRGRLEKIRNVSASFVLLFLLYICKCTGKGSLR